MRDGRAAAVGAKHPSTTVYLSQHQEAHDAVVHPVEVPGPWNELGLPYFGSFDRQNPLTVSDRQHVVHLSTPADVLATTTLPYTPTEGAQFASIHSNPPGVHTEAPAIVRKAVGKGTVVWTAAPIEKAAPHESRKVVHNLVRSLCRTLWFTASAPSFVEILCWRKAGKRYCGGGGADERRVGFHPGHDIHEVRSLPRQELTRIGVDRRDTHEPP
jgi:hypothetical protein